MIIPELISQLASWEVLALLSHHWPGNVREEEIAKAMDGMVAAERGTPRDDAGWSSQRRPGMAHFRNVVLGGNRTYRLCEDLRTNGVDVEQLQHLLKKYHLSILLKREDLAFETFQQILPESSLKFDQRLNVRFINTIPPFELAYEGLQVFCHLLLKDRNEAKNLLELPNGQSGTEMHNAPQLLEHPPEIRTLAESMRISLDSKSQAGEFQTRQIASMNRNELMTAYYKALLVRTKGNKSEAAKLAGLKYTTFREALRKYEIS